MSNPDSTEENDPLSPEKLALAKVGLIALIDEATGYQNERFEKDGVPLREMYEEFVDEGAGDE